MDNNGRVVLGRFPRLLIRIRHRRRRPVDLVHRRKDNHPDRVILLFQFGDESRLVGGVKDGLAFGRFEDFDVVGRRVPRRQEKSLPPSVR